MTNQTIGIYFPQGVDPNDVRAKLSRIAQAHQMGIGEMLAAVANGKAEIVPTNESHASTPPTSLVDLLESCATLLAAYPDHAAELRRRARLLSDAGL